MDSLKLNHSLGVGKNLNPYIIIYKTTKYLNNKNN